MYAVQVRWWVTPSTKKRRRAISLLIAPNNPAPVRLPLEVRVRNNYVFRTGGRKKTLLIGLVGALTRNKNVLLYRKLQWPELRYPVFTPFKRRVKALGQKVAPVIAIGGTGTGMDVKIYLGLTLMKLGGMNGF